MLENEDKLRELGEVCERSSGALSQGEENLAQYSAGGKDKF